MPCNHEYSFNSYCGANVCDLCGDHKGLARCYCGWPAGEKLDDDVGVAVFDGDSWEVDY